MNFSYFIAKKLTKNNKTSGKKLSGIIILIAQLAVSISIIVMLISISSGIGLKEEIKNKLTSLHGDLRLVNYDANNSAEYRSISLDYDIKERFPFVKEVQEIGTIPGILKTKTDFEGVLLKGVSENYNWSNFKDFITKGKIPSYSKKGYNDSILISELVAKNLKVKLGDTLRMYFAISSKRPKIRAFKIAGLFSTGVKEYDSNAIIGDLNHIRKINKWKKNEVGAYELFIDDTYDLNTAADVIYEKIEYNQYVEKITDSYGSILEWVKLFDNNILVIVFIMIIVAIINMCITILILIVERTKLIGLLKTLGATNWQIRKIFIYNAIQIMAKGLLIGNLIGLSILTLQKYGKFISLDPDAYYVKYAPVYLNLNYIIYLNLGSLLICTIVLILPSYYIDKIRPIKSINLN